MKNSFFRVIRSSFRLLLAELKPQNKVEYLVLIGCISYFSVILILLITVSFPNGEFMELMGYDTDIRFATDPIMMSSGEMLKWNIRHPLFTFFYFPVILLNELLLAIGIEITRPLFMFVSVLIMGYSCLILYKILRSFSLSVNACIVLLFLFCSFAHIILLGFQVDSFVLSLFFLLLMILLFVKHKNCMIIDNILFLGLVGTTSTNMIKFGFYQLIEERNIFRAMKRFLLSIPFFILIVLVTLPDLYYRLSLGRGLIYAFIGDTLKYTGTTLDRCRLFIDNFVSEPILFHNATGIVFSPDTIHLPAYPSTLCYIVVLIIFLLVILSVVVCRREKLVWLFCTCWASDIIIHFGVGYGMEEAQLFCGHWLFFIPIMIGMLMVHSRQKFRNHIVMTVAVIASSLLVYNFYCFIHSL